MIDALMYGITPSAKTVSLASAPPVNMSKNRRIDPCCASKKAVSAAPSIPGVGICAPRRKIRSIAKVKKMRCRSSSIRNIFCIFTSSSLFCSYRYYICIFIISFRRNKIHRHKIFFRFIKTQQNVRLHIR